MSRRVIDIATRQRRREGRTGLSRPAMEAAIGETDAPAGAVVSIGTPTRIGAALRAVRRDLPAEVLHAHLHDLRTCGDEDDLSVKLVGQWLEERVRVVTAVTNAKPTAAAGRDESQPRDDGRFQRRTRTTGKRRAAKPAEPCRGGDA